MAFRNMIIFFLFYFLTIVSVFSQTQITKRDYLKVIKQAEEKVWQIYENSFQTWQKGDPSKRQKNRPIPNIRWARMDGFLYAVTGERKYAERARKVLMESPRYDNYMAIKVLNQLENSGMFSPGDLKLIEKKIVEGADRAVHSWAEWGAMNHSTNGIVNTLSATIQYLPHHPHVEEWRKKLDINLSSSWGLWSIEDSQNYIPPWLVPMMQCVELLNRENEFYALPTTKYYLDYAVQLMTPDGQIVKFGDGGDIGDYTWCCYLPMLEKGASI